MKCLMAMDTFATTPITRQAEADEPAPEPPSAQTPVAVGDGLFRTKFRIITMNVVTAWPTANLIGHVQKECSESADARPRPGRHHREEHKAHIHQVAKMFIDQQLKVFEPTITSSLLSPCSRKRKRYGTRRCAGPACR